MKKEIISTFGQAPEKIVPIPAGLCSEGQARFRPAEARARLGVKENKVVLFFGFVRPYKGLGDLIIAFKEVADRYNVALVIAGEFLEGVNKYVKDLEQHGIAKRTHLFPWYIPYEEVSLFFSAADVIVQPYVRFSGQSGVTQTAYLHSIPVIATDVGGLTELVLDGDTGIIIKPGDPQGLAAALEALLGDTARRQEYGRNGKRFLENHLSWEKISQSLLEVYTEAWGLPKGI